MLPEWNRRGEYSFFISFTNKILNLERKEAKNMSRQGKNKVFHWQKLRDRHSKAKLLHVQKPLFVLRKQAFKTIKGAFSARKRYFL